MRFKNDKQRKAVMAKLRKGSTILYSYERKKNDYYGNPRHKALNISVIKKGDVVRLIDEVDIGYRGEQQAVFDELQKMGYIPKEKKEREDLSEDEKSRLKWIINNKEQPTKTRREALRKLYTSGKTNYWELRDRYNIKRL